MYKVEEDCYLKENLQPNDLNIVKIGSDEN